MVLIASLPATHPHSTYVLSYLPPGTKVHVPPWCLHRDARNFVCPEAFWPERWLVAGGHLSLSDAPFPLSPSPSTSVPRPTFAALHLDATPASTPAFIHNDIAFLAFSHGPMNCPGKGLAQVELRTVLCAILQRFRLRPREGERWDASAYEREFRDYFSATRPALPVVLERR